MADQSTIKGRAEEAYEREGKGNQLKAFAI